MLSTDWLLRNPFMDEYIYIYNWNFSILDCILDCSYTTFLQNKNKTYVW